MQRGKRAGLLVGLYGGRLERFEPVNAISRAREQLASLQQSGDLSAYVMRFNELSQHAISCAEIRHMVGLAGSARLHRRGAHAAHWIAMRYLRSVLATG